jgi:hypothetical protein
VWGANHIDTDRGSCGPNKLSVGGTSSANYIETRRAGRNFHRVALAGGHGTPLNPRQIRRISV